MAWQQCRQWRHWVSANGYSHASCSAKTLLRTHQFAATGNAELGFVALAQVMKDGRIGEGSAWIVPARLHEPIRQDAALLAHGRLNPAAAAFLAWLRSDKAKPIIRSFGYDLP